MIEKNDCWIIPLNGQIVTQIRIDFSFGLEFLVSDEKIFSVRINAKFQLISSAGSKSFDPENDRVHLGPALIVFMKKVKIAKAYKNGDLEVVFEEDYRIFVPSEKEYESWEVSGPDGLLVIGGPGKLAIWNS